MTSAIDLAPILALPVADRIEIANKIMESIPVEQIPSREISEDLKLELRRRLQEHYDNPDSGVPWEEVKQRLLSRQRT